MFILFCLHQNSFVYHAAVDWINKMGTRNTVTMVTVSLQKDVGVKFNKNTSIGESDQSGVNATYPSCEHGLYMLSTFFFSILRAPRHNMYACLSSSVFFFLYLNVTHSLLFLSLSMFLCLLLFFNLCVHSLKHGRTDFYSDTTLNTQCNVVVHWCLLYTEPTEKKLSSKVPQGDIHANSLFQQTQKKFWLCRWNLTNAIS